MAAAALAQNTDADPEGLTLEEALQVCAAFGAADERLACFEALASSAAKDAAPKAQAQTPRAVDLGAPKDGERAVEPPADAAPIAQEERAAPRFKFVRNDAPEEKRRRRERFEEVVYRAWRNGLGELRIAFSNGEIWVQAGRGVDYTPEPGEVVVFKPGLVGGWTLSMKDGRYGVRARRLNGRD